MLNGFPEIRSAYSAVDNGNKTETVNRVSSDGSNYYPSVAELSTNHQQTDIPGHTGTWNYPPYFSGFYNCYTNNPPPYELPSISQCESQKCTTQCSQGLNQSQLHSTPLVHCCDPRCQLLPDHSKFPVSTPFTFPTNKSRRKTKATFNNEIASIKAPDCDNKCLSYVPSFQSDLNGKYSNSHSSNFNPFYQNVIRHPKHQLYPSETSVNDYYSNIAKPPYWNRHNTWNNNVQANASYYPSAEHTRQYNQKMPLTFQPHGNSEYQNNIPPHNKQGILLNRLLDNHEKPPVYENGYDTQNYYTHGRQYGYGFGDNNGVSEFRTYEKDSLPPPYPESHHTDQLTNNTFQPYIDVHSQPTNNFEPNAYVKVNDTNKESDVKQRENNTDLNKNQNLDVREFLSTWDDVEDDKVDNSNVSAPVIVLDCSTLEGNALNKVKENLVNNFQNSTPCSSVVSSISNNDYNSPASNSMTSVIENTNNLQDPNGDVRENSFTNTEEHNSKDYDGSSYITKDKTGIPSMLPDKYQQKINSSTNASSNHIDNESWRNESKRKEDMPYDLVEMTERLVTTVDRLFNTTANNDKSKITDYGNVQNKKPETRSSSLSHSDKGSNGFINRDNKNQVKDSYCGDRLNINLNYKRIQNMSKVSEIDIALNKTDDCDIETNNELSHSKQGNTTEKLYSDKLKDHDLKAFGNTNIPFNDNMPCLFPTDKKLNDGVNVEPVQKLNSSYEDMSCNLNVQRTNNEIKNLYSFSVNYCKKATEVNKSDNYSLHYSENNDNMAKSDNNDVIDKCNNSFDKTVYDIQNKYPIFDSHAENRLSDYATSTEKCEESKKYEYYKSSSNNAAEEFFLHHSSNDYFNPIYKARDINQVDNSNECFNSSTYKSLSLNEKLSMQNNKPTMNVLPIIKSFDTTVANETNIASKNNILNNVLQQNENHMSLYGKSLLEIGRVKESETIHSEADKVIQNELNFPYLTTTPSSAGLCAAQPCHDTVIQKVNCITNVCGKSKNSLDGEKATILNKPAINEFTSSLLSKHIPKSNQLETQTHFNKVQNVSLSLNDVYENDTIFDTGSAHFPKTDDNYSEESWMPPKLDGNEHNKELCSYRFNFGGTSSDNFPVTETNSNCNYLESTKDSTNNNSADINGNKQYFDTLWGVEGCEKNDAYTQPLNLAKTKVDTTDNENMGDLSKQKESCIQNPMIPAESDYFVPSSIHDKSNQDVNVIRETKNTDHTIDSIVSKDISKPCLSFDEEPYFHTEFSTGDNKVGTFFIDKYDDFHNKVDNAIIQTADKDNNNDENNNGKHEISEKYTHNESTKQHETNNFVKQYGDQSEAGNNHSTDYNDNIICALPNSFIASEENQVIRMNSFHTQTGNLNSSKRKFNDLFTVESKKIKIAENSHDDFKNLDFNRNNFHEQTLPGCIVYSKIKYENNQENICGSTALKSNEIKSHSENKVLKNKPENESSVIVNGSKYFANNVQCKQLEMKTDGTAVNEVHCNGDEKNCNNINEINSNIVQHNSINICCENGSVNSSFDSGSDVADNSPNEQLCRAERTEVVLPETLFNGNKIDDECVVKEVSHDGEISDSFNCDSVDDKHSKGSNDLERVQYDGNNISEYSIFSEISDVSIKSLKDSKLIGENIQSFRGLNEKICRDEGATILNDNNIKISSLSNFKNELPSSTEHTSICDGTYEQCIDSLGNNSANVCSTNYNVHTEDQLSDRSTRVNNTALNSNNFEENGKSKETTTMLKNVEEVHMSLNSCDNKSTDAFIFLGNDSDTSRKDIYENNKTGFNLRYKTKSVDICNTNKLSADMVNKEFFNEYSDTLNRSVAEAKNHIVCEKFDYDNNIGNDDIQDNDSKKSVNDSTKYSTDSPHLHKVAFKNEIVSEANNNNYDVCKEIGEVNITTNLDADDGRKSVLYPDIITISSNAEQNKTANYRIGNNVDELMDCRENVNGWNSVNNISVDNSNCGIVNDQTSNALDIEVSANKNREHSNNFNSTVNENDDIAESNLVRDKLDTEETLNGNNDYNSQECTVNGGLNVKNDIQNCSVDFNGLHDNKLMSTMKANNYEEDNAKIFTDDRPKDVLLESSALYCNDVKSSNTDVQHYDSSPKSPSNTNVTGNHVNEDSTDTYYMCNIERNRDVFNDVVNQSKYAMESEKYGSTFSYDDNIKRDNLNSNEGVIEKNDQLMGIQHQSNENNENTNSNLEFVNDKCDESVTNSGNASHNKNVSFNCITDITNEKSNNSLREVSDIYHNDLSYTSPAVYTTDVNRDFFADNEECIKSQVCEPTENKYNMEKVVQKESAINIHSPDNKNDHILNDEVNNKLELDTYSDNFVKQLENNVIVDEEYANKNIARSDFICNSINNLQTANAEFQDFANEQINTADSVITNDENMIHVEDEKIAAQHGEIPAQVNPENNFNSDFLPHANEISIKNHLNSVVENCDSVVDLFEVENSSSKRNSNIYADHVTETKFCSASNGDSEENIEINFISSNNTKNVVSSNDINDKLNEDYNVCNESSEIDNEDSVNDTTSKSDESRLSTNHPDKNMAGRKSGSEMCGIHKPVFPDIYYPSETDSLETTTQEQYLLESSMEKSVDTKQDTTTLETKARGKNSNIYPSKFTVPRLKYLALDVLSNLSFGCPSTNNVVDDSISSIKVQLMPEKTEVTIHSKQDENYEHLNGFELSNENTNDIISLDGGDTCETNLLSDQDQSSSWTLQEKHYERGDGDDGNSDLQCQCLIVNSGEPIVCLNCSLNSASVVINEDGNVIESDENINYDNTNDNIHNVENAVNSPVIHSVCDSTTVNVQNDESNYGDVVQNTEACISESTMLEDNEICREDNRYSSLFSEEADNKSTDPVLDGSIVEVHNDGSSCGHYSSREHIFIDNVSYNTEVVSFDDSLDSDDGENNMFGNLKQKTTSFDCENPYIPLDDSMTTGGVQISDVNDGNNKSIHITDNTNSKNDFSNNIWDGRIQSRLCSASENNACERNSTASTSCGGGGKNQIKPYQLKYSPAIDVSLKQSVKCDRYSIPCVKVKIPWERMFNLNNNNNNIYDSNYHELHLKKSIELGPAKIEVHLSPDENGSWKVVNSESESPAPVSVKVSRLILQRASSLPINNNSNNNNSSSNAAINNSQILDRQLSSNNNSNNNNNNNNSINNNNKDDEQCVTTTNSENIKSDEHVENDVAADSDRLPKVVIKKTSAMKYESYLRMNAELQPVIRLVRNRSLDEMAAKLTNDAELKASSYYEDVAAAAEKCVKRSVAAATDDELSSEDHRQSESKRFHYEEKIDFDIATESANLKSPSKIDVCDDTEDSKDEQLPESSTCIERSLVEDVPEVISDDCAGDIAIQEEKQFGLSTTAAVAKNEPELRKFAIIDDDDDDGNDNDDAEEQQAELQATIGNHGGDFNNDGGSDCVNHHCILCRRSFPNLQLYKVHRRGSFHRYVELIQRKTIHAVYRHFTGHNCPRLKPLTAKEKRKMRWKPMSSSSSQNIYHDPTPLQIALKHKGSVSQNRRKPFRGDNTGRRNK